MEQRINALREQMKRQISQINSKENLSAFWQDFLGKKGNIAELMKSLGTVAKEDRPAMGKVINEFKVQVEEEYKLMLWSSAKGNGGPHEIGHVLPQYKIEYWKRLQCLKNSKEV